MKASDRHEIDTDIVMQSELQSYLIKLISHAINDLENARLKFNLPLWLW